LGNSKKVPALVLKLSDFLSFSLYETNEKFVSLKKEIQLMQNFIELQLSRFEDRVRVEVSIPEKLSDTSIPPMLFVPLVENAFKHSLKNETNLANIAIGLSEEDNDLFFQIENSKSVSDNLERSKGGIGLSNIKRRLDLIYKSDYSLIIEDLGDRFKVELKIPKLH
jgi:LytS/YehU family sensor histidine kinase